MSALKEETFSEDIGNKKDIRVRQKKKTVVSKRILGEMDVKSIKKSNAYFQKNYKFDTEDDKKAKEVLTDYENREDELIKQALEMARFRPTINREELARMIVEQEIKKSPKNSFKQKLLMLVYKILKKGYGRQ